MNEFPTRLKALRKARKINQPEMAKYLGLSDSGYRCYEQGRGFPEVPRLISLADYFGVSIDYLLGRTDEKAVNLPPPSPVEPDPGAKRNIALRLMYVGSAYHGWQVQKNASSVAETLEKALETVVCHPVKCTGAGRTDAGVHAETYVANFRTTSAIPCDRIPLAVNTRLPDDIVVVRATEVPDGFNAIGSCRKKEYTYKIYNNRLGNAFYVNRAWFYPRHLDETVMQRAADQFVGTHDFRAVRSVGTETKTTVRTVHYFKIRREGDLISCRVCADGFLYNMVRAMVGTVVYAAEGKLAPEDIPQILQSGNRTLAGPTVPPGGLYMTRLWYDEDV